MPKQTTPGRTVEPPVQHSGETVPAAVRAQILATEHWSLLGTRGTTWTEVMSRISIHLTIASAGLVVLALVGQGVGFGTAFDVLSIGLASVVLVLGTLTGARIHNASVDDAALIMGMNRIRAAYVAIDPGLAPYFVASWHDDPAGLMQTYTMGAARHMISHVMGSTTMFMNIVNAIVAGVLAALIANAANASLTLVAIIGSLSALTYFFVMLAIGRRTFARPPIDAHFPTTTA